MFSEYLAEKILAHVFTGVIYTPPEIIYISLHDESGPELQGASYERKAVSFNTSQNTNQIAWNNLPAANILGVKLWDELDNQLMEGSLPSVHPVSAGDPFTLNVGDITIGLN